MAYKDIKDFYRWQTNRRDEYRKFIFSIKKKINKCQKCGYDEHFEILQFHHRNPKDKRFKFSVGNLGNYKKQTIIDEINKCDLLCANCHNWIHFKETSKAV